VLFRSRDAAARIRWLRRPRPSITGAMNAGLLAARGEYVLYLDDDVVPKADLVAAHLAAHHANHLDARVEIVAGQVFQPGEVCTSTRTTSTPGSRSSPARSSSPGRHRSRSWAGSSVSAPPSRRRSSS